MDNRQIATLISERIGPRPVPFEAVRTLALEIYHDLGGREDDENFADIFEILLSILPLTNLIDDTSIYLDRTWSSYKIDASINQLKTSVEGITNFDCSTIVPTTTNFVQGTEYTIHEALQRTANLFGGYKGEIDDINALIPGQATESNQLADKSFVNSTVATNAANFRGNWTNWTAVPSNASLYPEDYVGNRTPTNNDYMMVQDASDYDGFEGSWRFIYVGDWNTTGKSGWNPQYKVGSTFTAVQQAAIDSGITDTKVATYDGYGTSITALQTDKLDKVNTALKIYGTDTLGQQISYEAGTGISFENGKISNTNTEAAWGNITGTISNQTDLSIALDSKQPLLTAGANVSINNNVISATDTIYTEGVNIVITDTNVLNAVEWVDTVPDSSASQELIANVLYKFENRTSDLVFTLGPETPGVVNEYHMIIECGSTAPTITWPVQVSTTASWYAGIMPVIKANTRYEISILENVATFAQL